MPAHYDPSQTDVDKLLLYQLFGIVAGATAYLAAAAYRWGHWYRAQFKSMDAGGADLDPKEHLHPMGFYPRFFLFARLLFIMTAEGAFWMFNRHVSHHQITEAQYEATWIVFQLTVALAVFEVIVFFETTFKLHAPVLNVLHTFIVFAGIVTSGVLFWVYDNWVPWFLTLPWALLQIYSLYLVSHYWRLRDNNRVKLHPEDYYYQGAGKGITAEGKNRHRN